MPADLTAAREALASADTIIPESAPWWELVCHREHGQGHYATEDEAKADLSHGFPCEDCRYLTSRVVRVQVAARPRSSSVGAEHLRAALAAVDELTAERDRRRATLALTARADADHLAALRFLEAEGYRRCDTECNCGKWHREQK